MYLHANQELERGKNPPKLKGRRKDERDPEIKRTEGPNFFWKNGRKRVRPLGGG